MNQAKPLNRRFCIAPMLDWTNRHCRYFHRLLTQHAVLYTEMVTTGAIIHGEKDRFLKFNASEHPVAIQLGGSDPKDLATCAKISEDYGYDEVNLNVGCPSDRVQSGRFGACLMADPNLVADCTHSMLEACNIPVTVKCRIGIDDQDEYEDLQRFVEAVKASGVNTFIVHARKAWLSGLSPKENRDIPPLNYERVYQLKREFPDLEIIINGGIQTLEACQEHLNYVDGVMMGREAYQNPFILAQVDSL
ncbi:MAG: tRNA dihydrouridine(20/20a) synthase DusA, partial [Pseudomonadales bacterium]|nr:tRNA dihydrouridine(20/20a) synthase DusA [Pseudomonadales bacterium]